MLARTEVRLLIGAMGAVALYSLFRSSKEHRANADAHSGLLGGPASSSSSSTTTTQQQKHSQQQQQQHLAAETLKKTPLRNSSPLAPPVPARPSKDTTDNKTGEQPVSSSKKKSKSTAKTSSELAPPLQQALNKEDSFSPSEAVVRDAERLSSFVDSERENLVNRNGSLSVSHVWSVLDEVAKATHDHADEVKAQLERHIAKSEEDAVKLMRKSEPNETSSPMFDLNVFLPATLETSSSSKIVGRKLE